MSDLEPNTREETFLAALSDDNITPPTPVTREELFLAKLAGQDVTPPTPVTRAELFLQAAIDAGGGGGGNNNRVQFITGSLADPFGEYESNVVSALPTIGDNLFFSSADCTALSYFASTQDAQNSVEGYGFWTKAEFDGVAYVMLLGEASVSGVGAGYVEGIWHNGEVAECAFIAGEQTIDLSADAANIAVKSTVYWHEMPQQQGGN